MSEIPIKPIGAPTEIGVPRGADDVGASAAGGAGFADSLKQALEEVNELQNQSTQVIENALDGDLTDVHSAMLAVQKADLSFQLMLQVRNKLVQAYRDVMRLQG